MQVFRLDFNGSASGFERTAQGFLRIRARLTKAGVFSYGDHFEYRPEEEIFRKDSLASLKGAPVTDLHPSENGDGFLGPHNAKDHIVGMAEGIEPDGKYLLGSLIVFHEDTIKAIEKGDRQEISLGFSCELLPTSGVLEGQAYDAVQRNIIFNHIAIGPKGWGRVGPECSIKTDAKPTIKDKIMGKVNRLDEDDAISQILSDLKKQIETVAEQFAALKKALDGEEPTEAKEDKKHPRTDVNKSKATIRIDEEDVPVTDLLAECQKKIDALEEELKALTKALEEEQKKRAELEDPKNIEDRVEFRLKEDSLKRLYPDLNLREKNPDFINGLYEASLRQGLLNRNDSLEKTRAAINQSAGKKSSYERWRQSSSDRWKQPLAGHL
jgi:hypothetical protein